MIGGEGLKIQVFQIDMNGEEWVISQNLDIDNGGLGGFIKNIGLDFGREEAIVAISDKRCIYGGKVKLDDGRHEEAAHKKTAAELELMNDSEFGVFKLMADPGHSDKVVSADLCARKPYIATCSYDKTLKVWDYVEKQMIFYYSFPEPLLTVAFHPSGYHVAVGFSDKIQFMNLYLGAKD